MEIVIHKAFLEALESLSKTDRRRTLTFLDKVRNDPASPGHRRHQVMNGFISLSPSMGIRVIAQSHGNRLVMLHIDQHDRAYDWAAEHSLLSDTGTDTYELISLRSRTAALEISEQTSNVYGRQVVEKLSARGIPDYIVVTSFFDD